MAGTTTNYNFPKRTHGTVAHQKTTEKLADQVDAKIKELEDRILALETGLNDSNSQFFNGTPG